MTRSTRCAEAGRRPRRGEHDPSDVHSGSESVALTCESAVGTGRVHVRVVATWWPGVPVGANLGRPGPGRREVPPDRNPNPPASPRYSWKPPAVRGSPALPAGSPSRSTVPAETSPPRQPAASSERSTMARTTPFHPWPCELRPECLGAHWPGCFTVRNAVGVFPAVRAPAGHPGPGRARLTGPSRAGDRPPRRQGARSHRQALHVRLRLRHAPGATASSASGQAGRSARPARPSPRSAPTRPAPTVTGRSGAHG